VADDEVPEDLVDLKIAIWAAEARCALLREQLPSAEAGQRERLEAELYLARGSRSKAVASLYAHSWWAAQPSRHRADQAVNGAARARADEPAGSSAPRAGSWTREQ
jgi:hypothetical protein